MPSKLTITSSIVLAPEKMLNLIFLLHYRILGTPAWQPTVIKRDEKGIFKIQTHSQNWSLPFRKGTMMSTIKYQSLCTATMLSRRGRMKAALMRQVERHPSCTYCSLGGCRQAWAACGWKRFVVLQRQWGGLHGGGGLTGLWTYTNSRTLRYCIVF